MEDEIALLPYTDPREQRNVEAWGEDGERKQELLYTSRVMVVGSAVLSQMVLANLVGLGVYNLCCVDKGNIQRTDKNNFLYSKRHEGEEIVKHIAGTLKELNPSVNVTYHNSHFKERFGDEFEPDAIIDATNDSRSKDMCLAYCFENNLPFISVASGQESAAITVWNPNEKKEKLEDILAKRILNFADENYHSQEQGSYTSGVVAGLAAEQFRKRKFNVHSTLDEPLKPMQRIVYAPHLRPNMDISFKDLTALIVGAGAVGNFVALNLALLGVGRIDIMDGDKIFRHNLSRQLHFYGRVGDFKAEVLSERIKEINDSIKGDYWNCFLIEETMKIFENRRYNVVFGCADTYKARYLINRLAVNHKIPLIDPGTSATSGSVVTYVPGKNRCIDCQLGLRKNVELELPKKEGSCINDPNPAIIIPNMIIGSDAVAEFVNIILGVPMLLNKTFKYNTFSRNRIYLENSYMAGDCGMNCL